MIYETFMKYAMTEQTIEQSLTQPLHTGDAQR